MTLRYSNKAERRERRVKSNAVWTSAVLAFLSAATILGVASPLYAQSEEAAKNGAAKIRVIKPFIGYEETFQWSDVPEIISEGANAKEDAKGDGALDYAWASDLFFEKQIWQLQFAYKNVRTIDVEYPTADGKLQSRRVWYMVYSVTNTGKQLKAVLDDSIESDVSQTVINPDREEEKFEHPSNNLKGVYRGEDVIFKTGDEAGAIKFVPRFVFASASVQDRLVYERKSANDLFYGQKLGAKEVVYYDVFDPIAMAKIARKEGRQGQNFLDTTRIANADILPGQTVWGVAIWKDVDPRVDKFSVYVSGLTNALKWEITDEVESEQVGSGRDIWRKVLKINFFNPGDEAHSGSEIYNNLPGELDYEWIYM
ncbi:MAG: hypothetical protein IJL92_07415 [Thermoguttaceae bacterium]|nr:hypothetical protein [Thermoguttaceae bacterium]